MDFHLLLKFYVYASLPVNPSCQHTAANRHDKRRLSLTAGRGLSPDSVATEREADDASSLYFGDANGQTVTDPGRVWLQADYGVRAECCGRAGDGDAEVEGEGCTRGSAAGERERVRAARHRCRNRGLGGE